MVLMRLCICISQIKVFTSNLKLPNSSVVRPWTNALTWLLLFFNIFWLPFLIMAIRYGYMHVIGGQEDWLLTLEKFQTTGTYSTMLNLGYY